MSASCNRTFVTFMVFFLLSLFPHPGVHAETETPSVTLTVKAAPDSSFESTLTLKHHSYAGLLQQAVTIQTEAVPPVTDVYLNFQSGGKLTEYLVDASGNLYEEASRSLIELSAGNKKKLLESVRALRSSHYGELLSWEQVKKQIPLKHTVKITDVETGLSFYAQRRAGRHHADVQPLTREDTAVMKQIYRRKWSWKRKAILVHTGKRQIAASMHGMPHGGDGIPDNQFAGHFCVHFLDSTTHGSGKVDPAHQLMVMKAAGELDRLFQNASPYDIVSLFFLAFHMGEHHILKMNFPHANHEQLPFFLNNSDTMTIQYALPAKRDNVTDLLSLDIPVQVRITRGGRNAEKGVFMFQMKRPAFTAPWKIDFIGMVLIGYRSAI